MTVRFWALIVLLGLLVFGGWKGAQLYQELEQLRHQESIAEGMNKASAEIATSVQTVLDERGTTEEAIRKERIRQDQTFEEMKRENPTVRAWADQPIPTDLRGLRDDPHR